MLMAPDDQVEKIWDERLWNETCWTPLGSILVKHQYVEPLPVTKKRVSYDNHHLLKIKVTPALLSHRQLKFNLILPEKTVQPLILHMGEAIQCHLGLKIALLEKKRINCFSHLHCALPQQHRANFDMLEVSHLAPVVDHPCLVDQVKARVTPVSGRIIVVSVDGENWQGDVQIWILVVDTFGVAVAKVHFWIRKIFHLKIYIGKMSHLPKNTCTGLSPKTRCLRICRQRISAALLGLFS